MKSEELLKHIKPEWHRAFLQFIDTGDAKSDFLDYVDHDNDAQHAVEMAFKAQAAAFETLAGELKQVRAPGGGIDKDEVEVHFVDVLSAKVADAMKKISELPAEEQNEAMEKTASALRASPKRAALRSAVQALEKAL